MATKVAFDNNFLDVFADADLAARESIFLCVDLDHLQVYASYEMLREVMGMARSKRKERSNRRGGPLIRPRWPNRFVAVTAYDGTKWFAENRLFILGAGFSAGARVPLTSALLDRAIALCRVDLPDFAESFDGFARSGLYDARSGEVHYVPGVRCAA